VYVCTLGISSSICSCFFRGNVSGPSKHIWAAISLLSFSELPTAGKRRSGVAPLLVSCGGRGGRASYKTRGRAALQLIPFSAFLAKIKCSMFLSV